MKRSERLVKEGKNLHNEYTLYTPEITHQTTLTPEVMPGYEGGKEEKEGRQERLKKEERKQKQKGKAEK